MKFGIIGIIMLVSAVIQTNIAGFIELFGVKPNLFVILITCFSLLGGSFEGAIIGLIAGVIQDSVSGSTIGGYALLGMYLGLIIGTINIRFVKDNLLVAISFVFSATLAYEFVIYFFAFFVFGQTEIIYALRKIIFPEAIYNAILAIPVFPLVLIINRWFKEHTRVSRKY